MTLAQAHGWYELQELDDGIVRITEPHVDKLLRANLWWLRGTDRDLVVDAGLGVASLRQHIPRMFERNRLVVLTHAHLDHVGAAHEFDERAAHKTAAKALAHGVPASLHGPELYQALGMDPADEAVPDLLIDALPHAGYDPHAYHVEPLTVHRHLHDGDVIDVGGLSLTALHLPGHTPGCIALHEEHTGALFTGDVIYNGHLIDDLPESNRADYQRSMALLVDLDVSVVHPGHGHSFDQRRLHALAHRYLHSTASSSGIRPGGYARG